MSIVIGFFVSCLVFYSLHRLCLWLEEKGHLYYLNRRPEGGFSAAAMDSFQELLNPGVRQAIEMHKNESKIKRTPSDDHD